MLPMDDDVLSLDDALVTSRQVGRGKPLFFFVSMEGFVKPVKVR